MIKSNTSGLKTEYNCVFAEHLTCSRQVSLNYLNYLSKCGNAANSRKISHRANQ